MSIRAISIVFKAPIQPPSHKLALLALADYGDDNGARIYPSLARLAAKIGVSRSQAQRIVRSLMNKGWLVRVSNLRGGRPGTTPSYQIRLELLAALADKQPVVHTGGSDAPPSEPDSASATVDEASEPTSGCIHAPASEALVLPKPLSIPKEPVVKSSSGALFDDFWSAYPFKFRKTEAMQAFEEAACDSRTTGAIFNALSEGLGLAMPGGAGVPAVEWLRAKPWQALALERSRPPAARLTGRAFESWTPDEQEANAEAARRARRVLRRT